MLGLFRKTPRRKNILILETWADKNSKKTTPDMLIAAAIVESLAKDFDDWASNDLRVIKNYWEHETHGFNPFIQNNKKDITVKFGARSWRDSDGFHHKDWISMGTKVNGVEIELRAARMITAAWEKIALQQKRLKEVAEQAKRDMEVNEKKWDLACNLLGMKRNEFGALVPIKTAEEATSA